MVSISDETEKEEVLMAEGGLTTPFTVRVRVPSMSEVLVIMMVLEETVELSWVEPMNTVAVVRLH